MGYIKCIVVRTMYLFTDVMSNTLYELKQKATRDNVVLSVNGSMLDIKKVVLEMEKAGV